MTHADWDFPEELRTGANGCGFLGSPEGLTLLVAWHSSIDQGEAQGGDRAHIRCIKASEDK
jgi:hypothetical protein